MTPARSAQQSTSSQAAGPPSLGERLAAKRNRARLRILSWLAIPLVLIILAAIAWFSPLLALRDVTVTGSKLVAAQDVQAAVLRDHASTPLPQIRVGSVASAVQKEFSQIASADVSYAGLHRLKIVLHDRVPVLALPTSAGVDLVDGDGVVVRSAAKPPKAMPELSLPRSLPQAARGKTITETLALLNALSAEQRATVSGLEATGPDAISAQLSLPHPAASGQPSGQSTAPAPQNSNEKPMMVTVVFGDSSAARHKYTIATQLAASGVKTVDVSVPEVPISGEKPAAVEENT